LLFESGWENASETGCDTTALIDGVWDDYGGSSACDGPVTDAAIVNDVFEAGSRSLRVTQKPCPTGPGTCDATYNGTDFRIVKTFGDQAEVTLVGWVRYDENYRFATGDHKVFIFTDAEQTAQNVYVNLRGQSGDPTHARITLAAIPADAVVSDATPGHLIGVGSWYRIRVRVVAGANGRVDAWLMPEGQAEVPLTLAYEAGNDFDFQNVPTGSIGGFKADTTYNIGNSITELMYQWYDSVAIYRP
jgi:hypothetical protein